MKFIISINVSNLCTENCKICPHSIQDDKLKDNLFYNFKHSTLPNTPSLMSLNTMKIVIERIQEFLKSDFSKVYDQIIVSVTGFGEPLLNPDILKFIDRLSKLKEDCNKLDINIITNAVTVYKINNKELFESLVQRSGKDSYTVEISIHDFNSKYIDQIRLATYNKISNGVNIRNHDLNNYVNELVVNNRGGLMDTDKKLNEKNKQCWYPLYEISIDTNGEYLLCAHDWSRLSREDMYDISNISIEEYMKSKKMEYIHRKLCFHGERDKIECCKYCNTSGTLDGHDNLYYYLYKEVPTNNKKYKITEVKVNTNVDCCNHSSKYNNK